MSEHFKKWNYCSFQKKSSIGLDPGLGLGLALRPTFWGFGLGLALRLKALACVQEQGSILEISPVHSSLVQDKLSWAFVCLGSH